MKKFLFLVFLTICTSEVALAAEEEEGAQLEEIVVTASMRVTAGGAQDNNFVRSQINQAKIPHPDDLTAEGLLSEYDLQLNSDQPCDQLFCLFYEANRSELAAKPSDSIFVGLGFATNIQADDWQRKPQNLIAVIDKSGSMARGPLEKVRRALSELAKTMKRGDQLSIVLYGERSYVYMQPTMIGRSTQADIQKAIREIESGGSTNMEEGLLVGYELADKTKPVFPGNTRLILFTDERPNVGNTSAESFMAIAKSGSARGVGLTTIGVGVQFDASLATKISSSRGGNLFYLDSNKAATKLFGEELDYMVSELAQDLEFSIRSHPGYQITGVYGVPQDMLTWKGPETVAFTLPTVFLSKRGGGVFLTLAPAEQVANLPPTQLSQDESMVSVAITYVDAHDGSPGSDSVNVRQIAKPSRSMQLASVLVDEYLSQKQALTAHHVRNDQETAYQTMRRFQQRVTSLDSRWLTKKLAEEIETNVLLLENLAFLSGHSSEAKGHRFSELLGVWKVVSIRGDNWPEHEKGNLWAFGPSWALMTSDRDIEELEWSEREESTFTSKALALEDGELIARYKLRRNGLKLDFREAGFKVSLKKVGELPAVALE